MRERGGGGRDWFRHASVLGAHRVTDLLGYCEGLQGPQPPAGPQTQKQVCSLGLGSGACSGWEGCEVSTCLFSSKGAALQEEVAPKRRLGDTGHALGGWGWVWNL